MTVRRTNGSQRLVRVADWGQIVAIDPGDGEPPHLVTEVFARGEAVDAAFALADRWRAFADPSLQPLTATWVAARVGGPERSLFVQRTAPRGSLLTEVLQKAGTVQPLMVAALLLDVARVLHDAHTQGLVAGAVSPDALLLCPPGLEGVPPLRLLDVGLPGLVAAAGGLLPPADTPGFATLHPCLETTAPEVASGQEPTAAADVYSLCATAAFVLLRRHVHAAQTPVLARHQAAQGLQPAAVEALQDAAPTLAPLLVRGLSVQPWGRAGVLTELMAAFGQLVEDRPRLPGPRRLLAPWAIGSPLVPLAAFAGATPYLDRLGARPPTALDPSHGPARTRSQGAPADANGPAAAGIASQAPVRNAPGQADQARLRAALLRLETERDVLQRKRAEQGRNHMTTLVVVVAFVLVVGAVLLIGLRQTRRLQTQSDPAATSVPQRRLPPPPRPRILEIEPEPR